MMLNLMMIIFACSGKYQFPFRKKHTGARSNFWGLSGSEDRGGGDNSIQFINIGGVGDKSFKK